MFCTFGLTLSLDENKKICSNLVLTDNPGVVFCLGTGGHVQVDHVRIGEIINTANAAIVAHHGAVSGCVARKGRGWSLSPCGVLGV